MDQSIVITEFFTAVQPNYFIGIPARVPNETAKKPRQPLYLKHLFRRSLFDGALNGCGQFRGDHFVGIDPEQPLALRVALGPLTLRTKAWPVVRLKNARAESLCDRQRIVCRTGIQNHNLIGERQTLKAFGKLRPCVFSDQYRAEFHWHASRTRCTEMPVRQL